MPDGGGPPPRASRGRGPDRDGQENSEDRLDHRGRRRLGRRLVSPGSGEVTGRRSVRSELLTADGTVTTLLEACTGEPIVTRTTRQSGPAPLERVLAASGRWWHPDAQLLELASAERVVARRVTLRGGCSDVTYVLAESLVVPDRLPGVNAECLLRAGASLGRLLTDRQLETRRAVLHIAAVRAGEAGDHLDVRASATLVRRTYTIVIGQRTVAAVTEWLAPGRLAAGRGHSSVTVAPRGRPTPRAPRLASSA